MEMKYQEEELRSIARECSRFEHIISAMGYGYSLLNVSENNFIRRCPDCVLWLGGSCDIFMDEIKSPVNKI